MSRQSDDEQQRTADNGDALSRDLRLEEGVEVVGESV